VRLPAVLRVLTLSSLFPDVHRPNFGIFVERQTLGLAALEGIELQVVAPVGLPPSPCGCIPISAEEAACPQSKAGRA